MSRNVTTALAPDYSVLVVVGAVLALVLLSGCASVPAAGGSDPETYNPSTEYPVVGSAPWHL